MEFASRECPGAGKLDFPYRESGVKKPFEGAGEEYLLRIEFAGEALDPSKKRMSSNVVFS
jgi:hypothetical protein